MPWSLDSPVPGTEAMPADVRADAADLANAVWDHEVEQTGGPDNVTVEDVARIEALAVAAAVRFAKDAIGEAAPPEGTRPPTPGAQLVAHLQAQDPGEWDLDPGMALDSVNASWVALDAAAIVPSRTREMFGHTWVVGPTLAIVPETTTHHGGTDLEFTAEMLRQAEHNARTGEWPLIPINLNHDQKGGAVGIVDPSSVTAAGTALYGQMLLSPAIAEEIRAGKWLGISPEVAFNAKSKRKGGKPIGFVLQGLALTNVPQLHDLRVPANFQAGLFGSADVDTANRTVLRDNHGNSDQSVTISEAPGASDMADTKTPDAPKTIEIAKLAASLGMPDDTDAEAALSAVAELAQARGHAAELEAKLTASGESIAKLTSENAALKAAATDAEKANAALSAKVEATQADIAKIKSERTAERVDHTIERLGAKFTSPGERKRARHICMSAESAAEGSDARTLWAEFKAELEARADAMQGSYAGTGGKPEGEVATDVRSAWLSYRDQQDGDTVQKRHAAAVATEKGAALYDAYRGTMAQA